MKKGTKLFLAVHFLMVLQKVVYIKGWRVSGGSSFYSCVIAMQAKGLYFFPANYVEPCFISGAGGGKHCAAGGIVPLL